MQNAFATLKHLANTSATLGLYKLALISDLSLATQHLPKHSYWAMLIGSDQRSP